MACLLGKRMPRTAATAWRTREQLHSAQTTIVAGQRRQLSLPRVLGHTEAFVAPFCLCAAICGHHQNRAPLLEPSQLTSHSGGGSQGERQQREGSEDEARHAVRVPPTTMAGG